MEKQQQAMNGVDVEKLMGTIRAIEDNPELARFQFRASTKWEKGAKSMTRIQGFHGAGGEDDSRQRAFEVPGDEPPVLLGENTAPNAVELALGSLASCLTVGFVYNAAAQGIRVDALDFDLEGDLDLRGFLGMSKSVRPGYEGIRVRYRVKSDAPKEEILKLCEYTQRTSPVLDLLRNPVPVEVSLET